MHEFSMVHSLADTIREHTPPGSRLVSAQVAVGELEHLDHVLLQTAWAAVMAEVSWVGLPGDEPHDTLSTAPTLELSQDPIRVRCQTCSNEYWPPDPSWMVCPDCGHARPQVLSGTGLTLLSLSFDQTTTEPKDRS